MKAYIGYAPRECLNPLYQFVGPIFGPGLLAPKYSSAVLLGQKKSFAGSTGTKYTVLQVYWDRGIETYFGLKYVCLEDCLILLTQHMKKEKQAEQLFCCYFLAKLSFLIALRRVVLFIGPFLLLQAMARILSIHSFL